MRPPHDSALVERLSFDRLSTEFQYKRIKLLTKFDSYAFGTYSCVGFSHALSKAHDFQSCSLGRQGGTPIGPRLHRLPGTGRNMVVKFNEPPCRRFSPSPVTRNRRAGAHVYAGVCAPWGFFGQRPIRLYTRAVHGNATLSCFGDGTRGTCVKRAKNRRIKKIIITKITRPQYVLALLPYARSQRPPETLETFKTYTYVSIRFQPPPLHVSTLPAGLRRTHARSPGRTHRLRVRIEHVSEPCRVTE